VIQIYRKSIVVQHSTFIYLSDDDNDDDDDDDDDNNNNNNNNNNNKQNAPLCFHYKMVTRTRLSFSNVSSRFYIRNQFV